MSIFARASALGRTFVAAAVSGAEKAVRAGRASFHVQQYQPWTTTNWSVDSVLRALELHEQGDFSESAKLAAAFGRDDRISACVNTRVRALLSRGSIGFDVEPSEIAKTAREKGLAPAVKALHWRACPEAALTRVLGDSILLGVSIARIHWEFENGQWRPWLEPWDMQYAWWDNERQCYRVNAKEGVFDVTPGTGMWMVLEPAGKYGWMAGSVRALGLPFLFRSFDQKDWARYCERHGTPLIAVTEPAEDAMPGAKESFYKKLRSLGREGIIRLPQGKDGKGGFKVEFLETKDQAWRTFEGWLVRLDVNIAVHLLGQNLSTEVQGGSLAASRTQNLVRHDYMSADAEGLSTTERRDIWQPWGLFNFSWFTDLEMAPWPRWNTAPPEDLTAKAQQYLNAANALEKFKKNAVPVDENRYLEVFGIPTLTPAQRAKLAEQQKKAKDAAPDDTDGGDPEPAKDEAA